METDQKHRFQWDRQLELSNENFGEKLVSSHYDSASAKINPFPDDYTLAHFSKTAACDVPIPIVGWEVLTTARNDATENGYFGTAFFNKQLCQVVVAHRGISIRTEFFNHAKVLNIRQSSEQVQSAATFVHRVWQETKNRVPEAQLSITGYSLGAWLAQITTFTVKYLKRQKGIFVADAQFPENVRAHTVVFHSPGCREFLEKLIENVISRSVSRTFINYGLLDMTVYLEKTQCDSTAHNQVGAVYVLDAPLSTIHDYIKSLNENKTVMEFNPTLKYREWNPNERSLNVFSEEEVAFLNICHVLSTICPKGTLTSIKQKYSIPDFDIDRKLDVIRADNVVKVIAFIKSFEPKDDVVRDFWPQS